MQATKSMPFIFNSVDLAVARVASRVQSGGHSIPEQVIRRRYKRGLQNFFELYLPLCDTWTVLNNSAAWQSTPIDLIAVGGSQQETIVYQPESWKQIQTKLNEEPS